MPEYVRVRLDNGTEKTVTTVVADRYGFKALDKPTHGRDGRMLAPKPRVPLGTSVSAKKSSRAKAAPVSADEPEKD
jgi:hypothetical protein